MILKNSKQKPLSKLIKDTDDWFSRMVRLSASNEDRVGRCFTCGIPGDVAYMDCGHFHSRKHYSTRWEKNNARLQCKMPCNYSMGDPKVNNAYKEKLIKEIGQVQFDLLSIKIHNKMKLERFTLEYLRNEFKTEALRLLEEKGIKKWW